jgi:hypothetical protein
MFTQILIKVSLITELKDKVKIISGLFNLIKLDNINILTRSHDSNLTFKNL